MTVQPATFDNALSQWVIEQNQPWGRLRYQLTQANLAKHIDNSPLHILDAGGGNGVDALALAGRGHTVEILDYSPQMLAQASQQAAATNISGRIRTHQGNVGDAGRLFPSSHFDIVLCHNVLQYVEDVPALFKSLSAPLKVGGLMSVVSINRHSMAYHAAFLRGNLAEAIEQLDARTMCASTFGVVMTNYSVDEIRSLLEGAGWRVEADYGLRCICDYWGDNERKSDPIVFEKIERLERELTERYPYKLLARYYQVIARKV